jgi:hypothetical protein
MLDELRRKLRPSSSVRWPPLSDIRVERGRSADLRQKSRRSPAPVAFVVLRSIADADRTLLSPLHLMSSETAVHLTMERLANCLLGVAAGLMLSVFYLRSELVVADRLDVLRDSALLLMVVSSGLSFWHARAARKRGPQ